MTVSEDAERAPLLGSQSGRENPTPLPWRPITTLLLLNSAQPIAYELVFPFINQMLLELGVAEDPECVGFYSGVIESIFAVTCLLTIFPASYASDRFGRKPVILIGITGLGFSLLVFGTSRSFISLVLSRCIGGGMAGAWAAVKVMLGELTDKSNQHIAFSYLMIAHRVGQIVGLPIGGFLAHPDRSWPNRFGGEFWRTYPFALPCFVGAGFAFFAVLCGSVFVRETRHHHSPHPTFDSKLIVHTDDTGDIVPEVISVNSCSSAKPNSMPLRGVLTKQVVSLLVSNLIMCTTSEALFTLFPLFAFTPIESGGLSFTESEIGGYLSLRALIQIGVMLIYPTLFQSRFLGRGSSIRMYRCAMFIWPITIALYPLLNLLASTGCRTDGWMFRSCLVAFFVVWGFGGYCWTTMAVMSNDASPSAEALAKVGGVLQVSVVLPQAIAPAFATSVFAASVDRHVSGRPYLHWIVFFVLTLAGAFHSFTLKEAQHDWRAERDAKRPGLTPSSSYASTLVPPSPACSSEGEDSSTASESDSGYSD